MKGVVIHTEFASQLRRSGLSQAAFARLCGVTAMGVNHWCKGRYPVPQWAWALANAIALVPASKLAPTPACQWFEVLGVDPKAGTAAFSAARSKLAKRYHPDLGGDTQAMQRINAAYDMAKRLQG